MRPKDFMPLLLIAAAAFVLAGCVSSFTKHTPKDSVPVAMGAATPDDTVAVADLKAVRQLNREFNPTPTSPLVDAFLGAAIAIASAIGGFMTRHQQQKHVDAAWNEATDEARKSSTVAQK